MEIGLGFLRPGSFGGAFGRFGGVGLPWRWRCCRARRPFNYIGKEVRLSGDTHGWYSCSSLYATASALSLESASSGDPKIQPTGGGTGASRDDTRPAPEDPRSVKKP